jgi:hypothetical protein
MKQVILSLLLAACCAGAHADVIGFDDLASSETAHIANGYGGFHWTDLGVIGADVYPDSGFANGVVSYANAAFNHGGATVTISKAGGFDFLGAFFTSAWYEQELSFEGSRDGQLIYATDISYVIDTLTPQWIGLGWYGIDTLTIYNSSGTQWAMDEFTVPEPGTLALFGAAAAGWIASRRRRRI